MQAILNKLWANNKRSTSVKAELREVKLSIISEIESLIADGENLRREFDDDLTSYYDRIISAKNDFGVITNIYDSLEENSNELKNKLETIENELAEFGLENNIEEVTNAKKYLQRHNDIISEWFEANKINQKIEV